MLSHSVVSDFLQRHEPVTRQTPLPMESSSQESLSGLPFPTPDN